MLYKIMLHTVTDVFQEFIYLVLDTLKYFMATIVGAISATHGSAIVAACVSMNVAVFLFLALIGKN